MDDVGPGALLVGTVVVAAVLAGGTAAYVLWPHDVPQTPTAVADVAYVPENETVRATIVAVTNRPEPPGTFVAEAAWTENDTVYGTEAFETPVRNGSSVALEGVRRNTVVRVRWHSGVSENTRLVATERIAPTSGQNATATA